MPASVTRISLATGASSVTVFALPLRGTLTHVDVTMDLASSGPIRASLAMQYDNDTVNRGPIGDGPKYLRGSASFGVQDAVQWDGSISLDSPEARFSLLVLLRNDVGSTQVARVSRVWTRA